jgi:hypothetical protein
VIWVEHGRLSRDGPGLSKEVRDRMQKNIGLGSSYLRLASDIPKSLIDPSQFDAAILNLVVNARDAMPMAARFGSVQSDGQRKPQSPDQPLPAVTYEFASRTAVRYSCGGGAKDFRSLG